MVPPPQAESNVAIARVRPAQRVAGLAISPARGVVCSFVAKVRKVKIVSLQSLTVEERRLTAACRPVSQQVAEIDSANANVKNEVP